LSIAPHHHPSIASSADRFSSQYLCGLRFSEVRICSTNYAIDWHFLYAIIALYAQSGQMDFSFG